MLIGQRKSQSTWGSDFCRPDRWVRIPAVTWKAGMRGCWAVWNEVGGALEAGCRSVQRTGTWIGVWTRASSFTVCEISSKPPGLQREQQHALPEAAVGCILITKCPCQALSAHSLGKYPVGSLCVPFTVLTERCLLSWPLQMSHGNNNKYVDKSYTRYLQVLKSTVKKMRLGDCGSAWPEGANFLLQMRKIRKGFLLEIKTELELGELERGSGWTIQDERIAKVKAPIDSGWWRSWASQGAQRWRTRLPCKRLGFDPWVGKVHWRRAWKPTPVFLPGESHGQRSLAGYSPWGHKRVGQNWAAKQQRWRY